MTVATVRARTCENAPTVFRNGKNSIYLQKKGKKKNDIFRKKIESMYPGIGEVPEDELERYMEYCDKAPFACRRYQDFKTFNELKEKCRKKGLESVIFRGDVFNVTKGHHNEDWNDGHPVGYDYILVSTKYGPFQYTDSRGVI